MRVQSRADAFRTLTKRRKTRQTEDRVTEGGYDSSSAPIDPATKLESLDVTAIIFSSPNIREDLTFEEATKLLNGSEHARTTRVCADQAEQLGLAVTARKAVGDWSDGAENTICSEVSNAKSYEEVERLAAMHGLASNQKSVIPFFVESDGPDAVYKVTIPRGNSTEIRKSLDEGGIQYRTIVSCRDSIQAIVFDKGSVMEACVTKFAARCRARSEIYKGRGDFLGGTTRAEGKAAYQKVLRRSPKEFLPLFPATMLGYSVVGATTLLTGRP